MKFNQICINYETTFHHWKIFLSNGFVFRPDHFVLMVFEIIIAQYFPVPLDAQIVINNIMSKHIHPSTQVKTDLNRQ